MSAPPPSAQGATKVWPHSASPDGAVRLEPVRDIERTGKGWRVLGPEPWLDVRPVAAFRPGDDIEVRYRADPLDEVCRPILRCIQMQGRFRDTLLPAPSQGFGIWRGRVPRDVTAILISPTRFVGALSFAIDHVRKLDWRTKAGFIRTAPKRAFFAASARMVRLHAEADLNLAWTFGAAETQDFRKWRDARAVPAAGLQASSLPVTIILQTQNASVAEVAASAASLRDQTGCDWRLVVTNADAAVAAWVRNNGDPRVCLAATDAPLPGEGLVGSFAAGDRLAPGALASFIAHFARHPEQAAVYCDEIREAPDGTLAPVFKPDWSPTREAYAPYVGRAGFVRAGHLGASRSGIATDDLLRTALGASGHNAIGHLRRALVTVADRDAQAAAPPSPPIVPPHDRSIGIVIPTRDRLDLLRPCVESVLRIGSHPDFRLIIVDNGSSDPRTLEWLDAVKKGDRRVGVLRDDGPFNFSALCNRGAEHLGADLLLFLNNDTVVLQDNWLDNLAGFAVQPDVGAVGAKLLYPSGAVQHAGVTLGLGGVAGHFGEGLASEAPGWLSSNIVPHEVSAVTGACLMVERSKFLAVGGFDEKHLPIELNDVDLCLRLGERGWRTICDCRTRLVHHQSASRGGAALRLQRVYAKERAYFIDRWRHVIRDDPYFNPNLSLYALTPRLA